MMMSQSVLGQSTDWSLLTPELAGTLRLGVMHGENSKWFSDFDQIKVKNSDSETRFVLKDDILAKGKIEYIIRPLKDSKGGVMQLKCSDLPDGLELIWTYGGASNKSVSVNWQPEIKTDDCYQNVFSIEGDSFTLYYGTSRKLKILEAETPAGSKLRLADAFQQETPAQLLKSGKNTTAQVVAANVSLQNDSPLYFCFYFLSPYADYNYFMLPELFEKGSYRVNKDTEWMKSTPD